MQLMKDKGLQPLVECESSLHKPTFTNEVLLLLSSHADMGGVVTRRGQPTPKPHTLDPEPWTRLLSSDS